MSHLKVICFRHIIDRLRSFILAVAKNYTYQPLQIYHSLNIIFWFLRTFPVFKMSLNVGIIGQSACYESGQFPTVFITDTLLLTVSNHTHLAKTYVYTNKAACYQTLLFII